MKQKNTKLFGYLKNSIDINGDIISPIDETWNANKETVSSADRTS